MASIFETGFVSFEGVKGYKTFEAAHKRGAEVFEARKAVMEREGWSYRWAVIVLANGRFAPMAIINNAIPTGPGMFLGERNLCMTN